MLSSTQQALESADARDGSSIPDYVSAAQQTSELFVLQFPFPQTEVRLAFSGLYVAIAIVLIATRRAELGPTFRAVLRRPSDPATPAAELT
jgi:hypothetical protein